MSMECPLPGVVMQGSADTRLKWTREPRMLERDKPVHQLVLEQGRGQQ